METTAPTQVVETNYSRPPHGSSEPDEVSRASTGASRKLGPNPQFNPEFQFVERGSHFKYPLVNVTPSLQYTPVNGGSYLHPRLPAPMQV